MRTSSHKPGLSALRFSVLGMGVLVAMCGCGGQAAASPSPSPNLGAEYLQLVAAPNGAGDALNAAVQQNPENLSQLQIAVKNLIDADVAFNTGLLSMQAQASPAVRTDIQAARVEISSEITHLHAAQTCTTVACMNQALDTYFASFNASGSVFVLLRSDLGLPPPPVGSPTPS